MHDDAAAIAFLGDAHHLGVGEAGHVVDDGGTQLDRQARDLRVARVDRDDGTRVDQRANHGNHALALLVRRNCGEPGARRLTADVDDVRALVEHAKAPLDRSGGRGVGSAVREGIGRDIEHAHNARARERNLMFSAAPGHLVFSKHRHLSVVISSLDCSGRADFAPSRGNPTQNGKAERCRAAPRGLFPPQITRLIRSNSQVRRPK